MYGNGTKFSVTPKESLPSTQTTDSGDIETEILLELEQKRKQVDEEIASFRAQKEKEFRDFETDLRASRRRKTNLNPSLSGRNGQQESLNKPPSRTSSSSALNLLAGRGTSRQPQSNNVFRNRITEAPSQSKTSSTVGRSVSQPVVSLDKLNIRGENAPPSAGRPRTPPTPTILSRTLINSSSSSSVASTPPKSKQQPSPTLSSTSTTQTPPQPSVKPEKHRSSFTGLFTPSYLHLLDSDPNQQYPSPSALVSPSVEDEVSTAPSSYKSNNLNEVLPISSSSFPPHVTMSPGGHAHASKRAYTAPTVSPSRIPSALRTASASALSRKAKHVTFRLADSAIVEPSSSYEEGPSPDLGDEKQKPKSGTRSPLRASKSSQLHRTLSPDEEDDEAGVRPGMGMGDVIQRLNEYTVTEAAKRGEELVLEVEDPETDDEDEDEDDDLPMEIASRHQDHVEDGTDRNLDIDYHEHEEELQSTEDDEDDDGDDDGEDEVEEDGYFSPKAKHISTMTPIPRDKDRLLFEARRHSDESDDMRHRSSNKIASPSFDETGFSGGLKQNLDGGSGVGFFELDEELTSPTPGHQQFEFELNEPDTTPVDDEEEEDEEDEDEDVEGLGLSTTIGSKEIISDEKKRWSSDSATKLGVGSVPIDIVRPSLSVSSSWVGTFGH